MKGNRTKGGQFKKGTSPWNKGLKGIHLSPGSEFKIGQTPKTFKGIGIPRIVNHSRDGKYKVTTIGETKTGISRGKSYKAKKRISYARYVMGVPKGKIVYHLDKNKMNDNEDNLIVISRKELLLLNLGKIDIEELYILNTKEHIK